MPTPAADYSNFKLNKLNTEEYRHLKYLLFWPVYLFSFAALERLWIHPYYHPVHCFVDDLIPFCEIFVIPYLLWFAELIFIQVWTLVYDPEEFKNFIRFLIIAFMGTICFYMIYPTCQELRVEEFARDNALTRFAAWLYSFDTNTNVCPSLHVIGAMGVLFSVWHARGLQKRWIRVGFIILTVLISMSTVCLKQHSFVDVVTAIPVSFLAYYIVYIKKPRWRFCKDDPESDEVLR